MLGKLGWGWGAEKREALENAGPDRLGEYRRLFYAPWGSYVSLYSTRNAKAVEQGRGGRRSR